MSVWCPSGVRLSAASDLTYLHTTAGVVTDTVVYDPFGDPAATTGTAGSPLGFQGDWTDPVTDQVWMGARWYQPAHAAFTSRDTLQGELTTPVSLNRYTYAVANPLLYWDPDGRQAALIDDPLGGLGPTRTRNTEEQRLLERYGTGSKNTTGFSKDGANTEERRLLRSSHAQPPRVTTASEGAVLAALVADARRLLVTAWFSEGAGNQFSISVHVTQPACGVRNDYSNCTSEQIRKLYMNAGGIMSGAPFGPEDLRREDLVNMYLEELSYAQAGPSRPYHAPWSDGGGGFAVRLCLFVCFEYAQEAVGGVTKRSVGGGCCSFGVGTGSGGAARVRAPGLGPSATGPSHVSEGWSATVGVEACRWALCFGLEYGEEGLDPYAGVAVGWKLVTFGGPMVRYGWVSDWSPSDVPDRRPQWLRFRLDEE